MSYVGDFAPGSVIRAKFTTSDATGAPITLVSGVCKAYAAGSTSTEVTTGVTLTVGFDGVTGLHEIAVDTSADGTFYAGGSDFYVVLTAGTVNGISVVGRVVMHFSLNNRSALRPTTAARTLDVSAGGEAGLDWANVGSPTTAQTLSGTTVGAATNLTNAPTAGDLTATMKASVTTAATAATPTVADSSGITTLLSRLSSARAGYLDNLSAGAAALESSLQGLITTIGASAAGVATAVWAAGTRTLTSIADSSGITTLLTRIASALTITGGKVDVNDKTGFALTAAYDAAKTAATQTSVDDVPTNAELATALAAADDAVLAAVGGLSIPSAAATASAVRTELATELGRVDAAVSTRATDAGTAAAITSDHGAGSYIRNTEPLDAAATRTAVGLASANLDTQIADLPTNSELATALAAADDAVLAAIGALSIPTAAQNAAGLLDLAAGVETGLTFRQALRLIVAAQAGKLSGAATTTVVIRNYGDSKDRITATVDSSGNRTAITADLT